MVFQKGYKNDKRYDYLLFDRNNDINKLPPTVIITNDSDQLKAMSYYFKDLLQSRNVKHVLFEKGSKGHMGVIFDPKKDGMILINEILGYLKIDRSIRNQRTI